jgi:hypothetical protein
MEIIGSVEFGDWINSEFLKEDLQAKPDDSGLCVLSTQRLGDLEIARTLLLEFLTLQDEMMQRAARLRS